MRSRHYLSHLASTVCRSSSSSSSSFGAKQPSQAIGHERRQAATVVDVHGGRLLRDAGARPRRPGPGAGGVLVHVGVLVAAHAPGRAGAAPRRARGPGAPRRVAPPPGRRGLAGRVHGRGVTALRRVPRAAARRRRRRGVRRQRRPARLAPHAGALQPPPLETGGACDQRVQARGHGAQGGEPRAGGDARRGAGAATQRGRPRRRQAGRLQRLPWRAVRHPDAHLLPAHAPLLGRAPLLARPDRGCGRRRGLRRLLRRRVRVGAGPRAAARRGGGRQVRGRARARRWRRGDDARVPARAGGGGGGQGRRRARWRRGGHRGGGRPARRRAARRVRGRAGAHRRPVRRGGGGQEEAAGPLQRRRQQLSRSTDHKR